MFLFNETSYLNEEVNCNEEPSLSVRVPCKKIDPKTSIFISWCVSLTFDTFSPKKKHSSLIASQIVLYSGENISAVGNTQC